MSGLCHEYHDFPLGGRKPVIGIDRPAVAVIHKDIRAAHVNHRLDGEDHPRCHKHLLAPSCHIAYKRILMELKTYTMTADFLDNGVSILLRVVMDSLTHIS